MKNIYKFAIVILSLIAVVSCSLDDDSTTLIIIPPTPDIIDMSIPDDMLPTLRYTIRGRGFYSGDTVVLRRDGKDVHANTSATAFDIQFTVPGGCSGEYDFCLFRNKQMYDLKKKLNIASSFDLKNVTVRSSYVRADGRITIKSPNMIDGDSIVITQKQAGRADKAKSVRVYADYASEGMTNSLTFDMPATYDDETTEIVGDVDVSVYRVTLSTYATTLKVVKEENFPFKIGDLLGGGVVYTIDPMTLDAYVVSMNYSAGMVWGPVHMPEYEVKTTSTAFGSGAQNTKAIVDKLGNMFDGNYAAMYCDKYSVVKDGQTYDDWFLPSVDEALSLYNSHPEINPVLEANAGDIFGPGTKHFHTSSEINGYNYVYIILWDQNPVTYILGKNFDGASARPVRIHKYVPAN